MHSQDRMHSQDLTACTLRTLVVLQHRHLADWMTAKVQPASIESHTLRVSLDIVMLVINHLKMHENMFFLLKLHYYYYY